jgi:iron complex outermembrane receptor protein
MRPHAAGPRRGACVALAILLLPGLLRAQRPDTARSLGDLDIEQLAKIRVTSVSRSPEPVGGATAAVFVVTADDIRRAGVSSLPEALRLAPGIQVARLGAQNWAVTSRGFADFSTNKLLVLIDGRAIYSPLFAGVFWDEQLLPVSEIERIEVILGPGATLWGSNAVNGVINIVTRPATATPGGELVARSGTENHVNATARYGLRIGDRAALRVYGNFLDREPIDLADGDDAEDGWQGGTGGIRLDFDAGRRDRVTVDAAAYDATSRLLARVAQPQPPFATTQLDSIELSGGHALARWTRTLSARSAVEVAVYVDRTIRNQAPSVGRTDVNIADVAVQHRFALRRHSIVWGAEYRLADQELRGTFTTQLVPPQRTTHLFTAFAQDEIALAGERLAIAPGIKLERNSYTGLEVQPGVRLRWMPRPEHTAWAAVSRALRTPSRLDEDIRFDAGALPTSPPTTIVFEGNRDFESERLVEAEAGYRAPLTRGLTVDLSAYYGWYDRLRSLTPEPPRLENGAPVAPVRISNFGKGHSAGGTAAIVWRPHRRMQLRGSYTFLDLADTLAADAPPGTTPNVNAGFSPRHQAMVVAYASLPRGVELTLIPRYVSPLHDPRVAPYFEADARLGWSPRPAIAIALIGKDLIHARHAEFAGGHYVPRRGAVQLTWRF